MDGSQVAHGDMIRVAADAIDPGALLAHVGDVGSGAVVLFLGTVRDHSPGRVGVTHLAYEAYQEHVEGVIRTIVAEARQHWDLTRVAVVHRLGEVSVGEASVGVAVSAAHRPEAFAAARHLIDELKGRAPIWKQEHWSGGAEWVAGA